MTDAPERVGELIVPDRFEIVPLESLRPADSPRRTGEDEAHARMLADLEVDLPPVLVNRLTMRIIDGSHRVIAASLRGERTIKACFVDCDDDEAFVLAVRLNVAHGLPMRQADRAAAAERILLAYPQWSDRAIAATVGVSHKTVGAIRRRSSGESPQLHVREGRDGRLRPVDRWSRRREAARLVSERPEASLREIARAAGVSATTVRDVRNRLRRGEDPVITGRLRSALKAATDEGALGELEDGEAKVARRGASTEIAGYLRSLRRDPSLRFSESGRLVLRLMEPAALDVAVWERISGHVPAHSAGMVARIARECARAWSDFADEVEQRRTCAYG